MLTERTETGEIWHKIVEALQAKGASVTAMESCTGGGIANRITDISGSSAVFSEGYITYSNEAKIKHGVPAEVIEAYGVYSAETAVEMAKAAKKLACADYAIGVTGQLGRIDPSNPVDRLNRVWFAIADRNGRCTEKEIRVSDGARATQKEEVLQRVGIVFWELLSKE